MTMKEKIQRSIEQKISEWQVQKVRQRFPMNRRQDGSMPFMRIVIAFIVIIVLVMFSFWVLGLIISSRNTMVSEDTPRLTDNFGEENEELSTSSLVEEEEISPSQETKDTESGQIQWQMYIQPDMPEPYIEVLKQYEQVVNANVEDFNDEEVMNKLYRIDGEWRYVYDLYGRRLAWEVEHNEADDNYRYSLKDLTGDGFPELIMGYYLDSFDKTTPDVVYYYSETEGIKMECLSDYYNMALYEGGIIEYISGGVTYTKTYLQFQEETESWELAVRVVVDWDFDTDNNRYYWGDDVGGYLTDNEPMSEEEYQKIMAQYTTEPVELEWTPLFFSE